MNLLKQVQLSAIVPVRSMAGKLDNLRLTLHSCYGLPIKIIIVHDDANDGTEEELKQLLEEFKGLYIEKLYVQYESPGLARNLGIQFAQADWICFWDSDDLPNPAAYISLLNSINSDSYDVLIGAIATQSGLDVSTKKTHPLPVMDDSLQMHLANMPGFTRMIFRRSVIGDNVFPPFKIGEDQCFLRKIEFLNLRVHYSEELLYIYVSDFEGQLSRRPNMASDIILTLEFLAAEIYSSPPKMQIFCRTQFLKLLLSSCRNEGWIRTYSLSPKTFFVALKIISRNPRRAAQALLFLAKNRPQLAGRT